MYGRVVLFFASLIFINCIFSPQYGPISSGTYEGNCSPRVLVCTDTSGTHCDSVGVKTYLDVGTKWIKFKSYAGRTLICRGDARLGEEKGDTLMLVDYRHSCQNQEGVILKSAMWGDSLKDTVPLIIAQQSSRGFRARIPFDTAWADFRKLR